MKYDASSDKIEKLLQEIVQPLLKWYAVHARILPWRENTDPYRIWVSEIMLQQTRVETVKPYYVRFMQRLPTLQDLANISEAELLKLWEGLGYYSRAKNLQKAARQICSKYEGIFPERFSDILSLPGIGEYTASAISSIAFEKPIPTVDGNVLRVISRLTANKQDIHTLEKKRQIVALLQKVYPQKHCGDFTQSLMELGEMVCIPGAAPKCGLCPLNLLCRAFQSGLQSEIPARAKKPVRKRKWLTVFLLCFEDKVAVRQRPPGGLLGGLWEFPNCDGRFSKTAAEKWLSDLGIQSETLLECPDARHVFTHVEWNMRCYLVSCRCSDNRFTWVTQEEMTQDIAMPTAFKKFQRYLSGKPFADRVEKPYKR